METMINNLIHEVLALYRKKTGEKGPLDRLQTREFRALLDGALAGDEEKKFWLDLLYYFPLYYQEGHSLIGEIPFTSGKVLDLGSGFGAYALAAAVRGFSNITRLETDEKKLDIGALLAAKMGYSIKSEKVRNPLSPSRGLGRFSLIIINRLLLQAENVIHKLTELEGLLNDEGFILIVEESDSPQFLGMRDTIKNGGFPIQAPCVWKGDCPARLAKAPCYAQRPLVKPHLMREIQRGLSINLSSLKMSYLIIRNRKMGWPKLPDYPLYRVISPPIEMMGQNRFYLCGTDGKKSLGSRLEIYPKEARAFEYLKRGELISFKDPLQNKALIDIVEGTEVKVEAALGKPLPTTENEQE